MRFAALTFRIAAIVGLLTILPMYFLYGVIGRADPPALNHPQIYFGFVGVTLAWQVLFWVLSTDPVRYRPMMIPAVLEKASFLVAILVLLSLKMMNAQQAIVTLPDAVMLVFFVASFFKTSRDEDSARDRLTVKSAASAS